MADRLDAKVRDFLALARGEDEAMRAEADALLDDLAPGVVALIAKVPASLRAEAVIVIADTRYPVGESVARTILRHVPSGRTRAGDVGRSIVYFAQPRPTVDALLRALGLPVPEGWDEPPEAGAARIALFLEVGLFATDYALPARASAVGTA